MRNVLKYPGSKNRISSWIVSQIPEHSVYLEPYFGGGSIFFNKKKSRIETINDLSGEVYNYFKVLREKPEELILTLHLTPFSRLEYECCYEEETEETVDEVERARRFAVKCCQGFSCSNKYRNGWKNSKAATSPITTNFWNSFPEILSQASMRLKEAQIEHCPALTLIRQYDKKEVFMYLDPPYRISTRKSHLYEFEMSDPDHEELLKELVGHQGKIMISGYDNDMYNDYLKDWYSETCNAVAESSQRRTEKVWRNYELDRQQNFFERSEDHE